MNVNEIFTTIEGETTWTGMPMLFIRFTGCPLRCAYCDTTYAYNEGTPYSIDQLMGVVADAGLSIVHLTGGEPLAQPDLPELTARLTAAGYRVVIETGGSRDVTPVIRENVHIMLDIKTPASGMDKHNRVENYARMRADMDEFKFVICDRTDFEWSLDQIAAHNLLQSGCVINMSPVFPALEPRTLAEWILETKQPIRLNCQLHKFVWPERNRGV